MRNNLPDVSQTRAAVKSFSGHLFNPSDHDWKLSKNVSVPVGKIFSELDPDLHSSCSKVLETYARTYSGGHVESVFYRFMHYLRTTNSGRVTPEGLINYRSSLNAETEWFLGTLRPFFRRWRNLGFEGISRDVVELLDGWTLKGAVLGDRVKRLDPTDGPLTNIELQAFNEGATRAYESRDISLRDFALGLVTSNTGRRPVQISFLRRKDVLKGTNNDGEDAYFLNVPRAKQPGTGFRAQFKQFAITKELWVILTAQAEDVLRSVKLVVDFELQSLDTLELPLFPDIVMFNDIKSLEDMGELLETDKLHISTYVVTAACKKIAHKANIYSERTGELLKINSRRFRYTIGTRAAAEGFGKMVIAELLDHSTDGSAGVYVENRPEFVQMLNRAVGHQLAPYAQAFAGKLVDTESDAIRGDDLSSRVKVNGQAIATCGNQGFCGANVPIPCYTCVHFQPWVDGPHELVYEKLISDRNRVLEVTGDEVIAAVNDRSILAVADVIQRVAVRKAESDSG